MSDDPKGSTTESAPAPPPSPPPAPPTPPPFAPDLDLIGDLERGQRAAVDDRTR